MSGWITPQIYKFIDDLKNLNKHITWREIAEEINKNFGIVKNANTVKKAYFRFKKKAKSQNIISITDEQKILYLERELSATKSKLKKLLVNDYVEQKIIEAIAKKEYRVKAPGAIQLRFGKGKIIEEAVLMLSDLHIGELVDFEEMGGLNEYNIEVFYRRLKIVEQTLVKIITIMREAYKIETLNIFGLGDWVSGFIHLELAETNDIDITTILFEVGNEIANMIARLSTMFKRINFIGIFGNHGRLTKDIRYKKKFINWDYIFYHTIALYCKDLHNVNFTIPKSFWHISEIQSKKFLLLHGDNIKSYLNIPWYGIQKMVARLTELLASRKIFFDYTCLAHFHNSGTLQTNSGKIILNGCFLPGQTVILSDGTRENIENIKEGTEIINILGQKKKVKKTLSYDYKGDIINFTVSGISAHKRIMCTPNHEIYAIKATKLRTRRGNGNYNLLERGNLNENSKVKIEPKWIPAEYLSVGDYVLIPSIREEKIPEELKRFDADFYRLIGLYLAEGSISGAKGKLYHTTFTFNINEEEYADFVSRTIEKYFNYKPSIKKRKEKTICEVVINRTEISKFFYKLCKKGSGYKKLDESLMYLPRKYKMQIILGWIMGDGHIHKQKNMGRKAYIVSTSTISRNLAWQMRQLSIDCGLNVNLSQKVDKKNKEHRRVMYELHYTNCSAIILSNLLKETMPNDWKDIENEGFIDAFWLNGQLFKKIKTIWTTYYEGKVYDLSIDTDDKELGASYMIDGIGVHNSLIGGNEYSLNKLFSANRPEQTMFGVHKEHGITWRYDINL